MKVSKIFNYTDNHWEKEMTNRVGDERDYLIHEYTRVALEAFFTAGSLTNGGGVFEGKRASLSEQKFERLIKLLDKHAKKISQASDGFRKNFRVRADWFRIILAQVATFEFMSDSAVFDALYSLYKNLGWNTGESLYPNDNYSDVAIDFNFDCGGKQVPCKIMLESTEEFPIHAQYVSSKGKVYNHVENTNDHHMLSANDGSGWTFPVTSDALRGMKRIK